MIMQERVKEVLSYDPETGLWVWLVSRGTVKKGKVAGSIDEKGYVRIAIDGRYYRAHRLAFLYVLGRWPTNQVDHKDLDKKNNSWLNLRESNNTQNNANRLRQSNNTSGHRGVHFFKPRGTWRVSVGRKCIGYFRDFADAATAYNLASYLEFGEFYRG